jgi:hypothetical protein
MTIHCLICATPINSVLIEKDQAIAEIMDKLINHAVQAHKTRVGCGCLTKPCKHKNMNNEFQELSVLEMQYLIVDRFAKIPEDESYFSENVIKIQNRIMELLGFEEEEKKNENVTSISN